jgi:hypothetical protein
MKLNRPKFLGLSALILFVILACVLFPSYRPPLEFSPDSLPDAQAGIMYSADIVVTQNQTPMFQAEVIEGTLPAGLALELVKEENLIRISGTPTESGSFTFTVGVACYGTSVNGQTGTKQYMLVVTDASNSSLIFSPDNLADAQVGSAYDAEIQVLQTKTPVGGVGISEGALPAGLTLEMADTENTLRIRGTPSESGTFSFTVSVWCYGTNTSGQTGEKKYVIVVK